MSNSIPKFYRDPVKPVGFHYVPADNIGFDSQVLRQRFIDQLALADPLHPLEPQVLVAMVKVPRHLFVDMALASKAYTDAVLPIGSQQTISKPSLVAKMLSLLMQSDYAKQHGKCQKILEIGTGCGYQTALLSHLAQEVYSLERIYLLHSEAKTRLTQMGYQNLRLWHQDGSAGWFNSAANQTANPTTFEGIILAAASPEVPTKLLEQLTIGGRLVMPFGTENQQRILVMDKTPQGLSYQHLDEVQFVPLLPGTC
ncbi:MAG: protein-L-isoaspartate(D-aspartate) O-methyltransferase [Gammaproteobacteria bacterium]|nr:protein-L-isoaspartate(D-aspartate) O-methyltransferase [Gammaproteobacteria bacterium]